MKDPNYPIMTAVSMGASATSNAIQLDQEMMYSVQAVWTGSPVGDFTLEICDDAGTQVDPSTGQPTGLVNWCTYTGSTVAAGGDVGKFVWNIWSAPARWFRLVYTRTSGTGTVNARVNEKG